MQPYASLMRSVRRLTPLLLRLALGVSFLNGLGDRFGLLGPPGAHNIAWGNFAQFTQYTARLNPWSPPVLVPLLAWTATAAELVLSLALLAGLYTEEAALGSGILLLLFGLGMTIGTGLKSALNASVFSAAAAAFALALLGPGFWSLDGLRRRVRPSDGAVRAWKAKERSTEALS